MTIVSQNAMCINAENLNGRQSLMHLLKDIVTFDDEGIA